MALRAALWSEPIPEAIPVGQLKEVLSIAKAQSTLPLICQAGPAPFMRQPAYAGQPCHCTPVLRIA